MANHTRKMTVDPVLQRIIDSLIKQNKTQKSLIDYLEMHPNTFNNWKYANSKSYYKHNAIKIGHLPQSQARGKRNKISI